MAHWDRDIRPGDIIVEWREGHEPHWWRLGMSVMVLAVGAEWITVSVDSERTQFVRRDSWESRLRYSSNLC